MASADEYAQWIVANASKKGTPEFDTVAKAYQVAKSETAPVGADNTPSTQTFTQKLLSNPVVRGAYGLAEGGTATLAGLGASAVGGINGINTLLGGGSLDDAAKSIENMQDKAFQPKTAEGVATAHLLSLPVEKAADIAGKFGGGIQGLANGQGFNRGAANAPLEGEGVTDTRNTDLGHMVGNVGAQTAAILMGAKPALRAGRAATAEFRQSDPFVQAKALREAGNDSMRLDSIAKAKEYGLTLNPTAVQKTLTNKTASALIGDTELNQAALEKNKPVMNRMVKNDIGVPDGVPMSKEVLQSRIAEAAAPYEEVRKIPAFTPDKPFASDIAAMNDFSNHSPAVQDFLKQNTPKLQAEMQVMSEGGFNGNDVVTLMQKFRKEANSVLSNKAQQSPEALALANAQRTAAKAIEGMVDRNLATMETQNPGQGFGDLASRFRDGRTTIAKIKTVEPFIDGNGNFVPTKSFRLSKNNAAYTGNLKVLSDVAGSFPESFNPSPLSGGPLNVSHSGVLNTIRHVISSPVENYVLSNKYQQKNMSGLDPRDMRTRNGYGTPPVEPQPFQMGFDDSPLPQSPQAPMPEPRASLAIHESDLPLGGIVKSGTRPQANSTPFQDPSAVNMELRQEFYQRPEIVKATEAFSQEANRLQDLIKNSSGFWRNKYINELNSLQAEFDAGMKLTGSETRGDANGIARALYQGGEGTQRPVEKSLSLADRKRLAEQLRRTQ